MKKIVIHCASGIRNTGDEAILDVLVRTFRERCEITVICLDASGRSMHGQRGSGLESGSGGL